MKAENIDVTKAMDMDAIEDMISIMRAEYRSNRPTVTHRVEILHKLTTRFPGMVFEVIPHEKEYNEIVIIVRPADE